MRAEQWILEFQIWLQIPGTSLVSAAMRTAIVDTGPLVAFLDRAEQHHRWVVAQIEKLNPPLLVCGLLENGALRIAFSIDEHVPALRKLHQKYRDRPMSLADACIVRMAEIYEQHAVLTLDADFSVYRKHGRVPLSLIHPAAA